MKKFLSALALMVSIGVFWMVVPETQEVKASTVTVPSEQKVIDLTREEYIQKLSEIKEISLDEAENKVNQQEFKSSRLRSFASARSLNYQQRSATQTVVDGRGARCQVTYGFLATLDSYGSYRGFLSTEGAYVLASGNGSFDWKSGNAQAKVINGNRIEFYAAGVIDGQVSSSLSAGFSAGGFSVSSSSGSTLFIRKNHTITDVFNCY